MGFHRRLQPPRMWGEVPVALYSSSKPFPNALWMWTHCLLATSPYLPDWSVRKEDIQVLIVRTEEVKPLEPRRCARRCPQQRTVRYVEHLHGRHQEPVNWWSLDWRRRARIGMACSSIEGFAFLVSISKIDMMPSIAPLAKYLPSGENAKE